ncbi:hypothetical protein I4U23_027841 [Adineta vaga]|nr:hypothetical protein I4U23_027841 [Adineta vaga]
MSDEDERQTSSSQNNSTNDANNRRLFAIKSKLHELTREKTKYNVEKLTHDIEFLHNDITNRTHEIAEINKEINAQTSIKKTLNAQIAILRSNSRVRYTNLQIALQDKQRYEEELEKPGKNSVYRDLAQGKINSIVECLPQLQKLDEYNQRLHEAEDIQTAARNKREKFVEILNAKTRKQTEIKQLLYDSATRLPEIEQKIESLRSEREQVFTSMNLKKQRCRISLAPVQSLASLEQDNLEHEKQQCQDQLEKIRLLLKYFYEKMSEHHIFLTNSPCSTPTTDLLSPLYYPLTPVEEQTILSSYMDEQNDDKTSSRKLTTSINQSTIAIAMKLPRTFTPLNLQSTTTNEIIRSPYHQENSVEYKKELPADIVDKYAGITKKKQQQQKQHGFHGKKNKKNKKNFGMKHSSQMIYLYDEVRTSTDNSDTLPFMPMFEYELSPTVKALQLMEQSVESYLKELLQRDQEDLSSSLDEQRSEIFEENDDDDDDIQDSALDTYSEASSIIETTSFSKDLTSVLPQLTNIPEARSSSSSDDKKTVVSSSSPSSSHHSHSKTEQQSLSTVHLTTVEELPSYLPPLTIQIAQIERQISDEGYRSIRNDAHLQQTTGANSSMLPLLTRSSSYDCTEKVDRWLSSTTPPSAMVGMDENINDSDFQATDNVKMEENLVQ